MATFPRFVAAASRTSRGFHRQLIVSNPRIWQTLHTSTHTHAKKKKQQAVKDDDMFLSESDEEDLFGGLSKSSQTSTAASQAIPKRVEQKSHSLFEDKALQLVEQKRAEEFSTLHSWLIASTGHRGKQGRLRPKNEDLRRLVSMAKTDAEFHQVITVLRQWRAYPARTHRVSLEVALLEKAIETSNVPLLIPVLMHHPLYGISVPSLQLARRLLKSIISPVNAYPPPYSPSNRVNSEQSTDFVSEDHVTQALQLTEVLSATILPPIESSQPPPLSPSSDLVGGVMLLSLLLRVPMSGMVEDKSPHLTAIVELAQKLQSGSERKTISRPEDARERLWTLAALRECQAALMSEEIVAALDRVKSEGKLKMDAKSLSTWIASEMLELEGRLSSMGLTVVKKARIPSSPPRPRAHAEQSASI